MLSGKTKKLNHRQSYTVDGHNSQLYTVDGHNIQSCAMDDHNSQIKQLRCGGKTGTKPNRHVRGMWGKGRTRYHEELDNGISFGKKSRAKLNGVQNTESTLNFVIDAS